MNILISMNILEPLLPELEPITDQDRAAILMQPLRIEILKHAQQPASSSEIARRLDMPRQKINYHLKALEDAGFLRLFEERMKRNMVERLYVASARAYLISPTILGSLNPDFRHLKDRFSAGYLLALAGQTISDLTRVVEDATERGKRISTLSIVSDIYLENAEQRTQFNQELNNAIADVIDRYTAPNDSPAQARPYRLILGLYPTPPEPNPND